MELQTHIEQVTNICDLIEKEEDYVPELTKYMLTINQIIHDILAYAQKEENTFTINETFVLTVLNDLLYGMENKDSVYLLDTLKYGLLEIYYYTLSEIQIGDQDE